MSLEKAIKHKKEHRKPYYRTKSRHRCNCQGCQAGRRRSLIRQTEEMKQQEKEYLSAEGICREIV